MRTFLVVLGVGRPRAVSRFTLDSSGTLATPQQTATMMVSLYNPAYGRRILSLQKSMVRSPIPHYPFYTAAIVLRSGNR